MTKNAGEFLSNLIVLRMWLSYAGCIAQLNTSGFTRSHWMPPLGECLHCIPLAAAMVDGFGCNYKNTTKAQVLATVEDGA